MAATKVQAFTVPAGAVREASLIGNSPFPSPRHRMPVSLTNPVIAGKLRNLTIRAPINSLDGNCVVGILIGGVLSTLTVTIPAGQTTFVANAADLAVAMGDLMSFQIDATAAGAGSIQIIGSVEFVPDA